MPEISANIFAAHPLGHLNLEVLPPAQEIDAQYGSNVFIQNPLTKFISNMDAFARGQSRLWNIGALTTVGLMIGSIASGANFATLTQPRTLLADPFTGKMQNMTRNSLNQEKETWDISYRYYRASRPKKPSDIYKSKDSKSFLSSLDDVAQKLYDNMLAAGFNHEECLNLLNEYVNSNQDDQGNSTTSTTSDQAKVICKPSSILREKIPPTQQQGLTCPDGTPIHLSLQSLDGNFDLSQRLTMIEEGYRYSSYSYGMPDPLHFELKNFIYDVIPQMNIECPNPFPDFLTRKGFVLKTPDSRDWDSFESMGPLITFPRLSNQIDETFHFELNATFLNQNKAKPADSKLVEVFLQSRLKDYFLYGNGFDRSPTKAGNSTNSTDVDIKPSNGIGADLPLTISQNHFNPSLWNVKLPIQSTIFKDVYAQLKDWRQTMITELEIFELAKYYSGSMQENGLDFQVNEHNNQAFLDVLQTFLPEYMANIEGMIWELDKYQTDQKTYKDLSIALPTVSVALLLLLWYTYQKKNRPAELPRMLFPAAASLNCV